MGLSSVLLVLMAAISCVHPLHPLLGFYTQQAPLTHRVISRLPPMIYAPARFDGYQGLRFNYATPVIPLFAAPAEEPHEVAPVRPSPVVRSANPRIDPTNFHWEQFNEYFKNYTKQTVTVTETVTLIVPTAVTYSLMATALPTAGDLSSAVLPEYDVTTPALPTTEDDDPPMFEHKIEK